MNKCAHLISHIVQGQTPEGDTVHLLVPAGKIDSRKEGSEIWISNQEESKRRKRKKKSANFKLSLHQELCSSFGNTPLAGMVKSSMFHQHLQDRRWKTAGADSLQPGLARGSFQGGSCSTAAEGCMSERAPACHHLLSDQTNKPVPGKPLVCMSSIKTVGPRKKNKHKEPPPRWTSHQRLPGKTKKQG